MPPLYSLTLFFWREPEQAREMFGMEINPKYAAVARQRGFNVTLGDVFKVNPP